MGPAPAQPGTQTKPKGARRSGVALPPRAALTIALCAILLIGFAIARLFIGGGELGWAPSQYLLSLRLWHVSAALAVGASLAVSGVLLQSTLRNPLASPFVLGLTSGAGLGLVIATYISYLADGNVATDQPSSIATLIGAFAALALVYALSQRRGLIDPATLLLVGVMVSIVCGAFSSLFQSMLPGAGVELYVRWMMGNINDTAKWPAFTVVMGICALGTALAAWQGRALDAAALGEDEARSVGVPMAWIRLGAFILAGVLTAGAVVIAGPIGFVGLVCPHAVRLLAGPKHRTLVIGSALAGAALLVGADALVALTETLTPSGRLPVGVLTSLVGGPVFLFMLWSKGARW